jgi:hypothetical protein
MIRACFYEKDHRRSGACRHGYSFDAELTLDTGAASRAPRLVARTKTTASAAPIGGS